MQYIHNTYIEILPFGWLQYDLFCSHYSFPQTGSEDKIM